MDPNAGKKNLFNKLNKAQALDLVKKEKFKRKTISFYRYVLIEQPHDLRDQLYKKWNKLGVLGRIYLSGEGVNAQLSVPEKEWDNFVADLHANSYFERIRFKAALEEDKESFFKLTIKVRKQIVADGLNNNEYDVTNVGKHLDAKQWNTAIDKGAIIIDMRNHYESEIGRFKGAICPDVETFKEELPLVKTLLKGKEDEKILLYCTGGIRCEKTSAYLKHYGFSDVNQLHGGIIDYAWQIKEDKKLENKFEGKNFVFDERRGERISDSIISNCHQCGESCDTHVNCANVNCNLLFIQCNNCKSEYENCCSVDCIKVMKLPLEKQIELRKGKEKKKMYYSHKRVKLNLKK
tara:strand:+ start:761 stop:1807 length:1047 start_codon:yes stop_codon:yes gene_type:complete